jgi:hypothetical protein
MKKICITLNDVIRRHFNTFEDIYTVYEEEELHFQDQKEDSNYEFGVLDSDDETFIIEPETKIEKKILNLDGLTDPMQLSTKFKFESKQSFLSFLYEEMAFEIFAKTNLVYSDVMLDFLQIQEHFRLKNIQLDVVSMEIANSKPATLFFLAREKCKLNNLRFVPNYQNIWDQYQAVITADNYLIENKKFRKKLFKIETENNKHLKQGDAFKNLKELLEHLKNG